MKGSSTEPLSHWSRNREGSVPACFYWLGKYHISITKAGPGKVRFHSALLESVPMSLADYRLKCLCVWIVFQLKWWPLTWVTVVLVWVDSSSGQTLNAAEKTFFLCEKQLKERDYSVCVILDIWEGRIKGIERRLNDYNSCCSAEDPGRVPSMDLTVYNHLLTSSQQSVILVPRDPVSASGLPSTWHMVHKHIQANIHIHKRKTDKSLQEKGK